MSYNVPLSGVWIIIMASSCGTLQNQACNVQENKNAFKNISKHNYTNKYVVKLINIESAIFIQYIDDLEHNEFILQCYLSDRFIATSFIELKIICL